MFAPLLFACSLGLVVAAIASRPGLLPRAWWWQAFVCGPSAALGFCLGWVLGALALVAARWWDQGPRYLDVLGWAVLVGATAWSAHTVAQALSQSARIADAMGVPPQTRAQNFAALGATVAACALPLGLVWRLTRHTAWCQSALANWVAPALAWVVSALVVAVALVLLYKLLVLRPILAYFAKAARKIDRRSHSEKGAPSVPERSGSPNSLSSWDSIGGQGRLFLGHGPGREEIERLTGRPALEPVRAYVGLSGGAGDVEEQARMAVRELRRAGAFERSAICVATATGSGWVDEWMTQPLEYLTGGDCATVSIQYSYLFSAVMMLSDLQPCLDAGRALFEAVEAEVAGLPEPRPRLFVAGESLGAQGSQAAFESLEDLLARVDGAIWAGSPAQSSLLQEALDSRDHGSPYVAPVVDGGRHVRFFTGLSPAADGGDWSAQPWVAPRVAFMQHPSDPVVFYEPSIAFRRPPWYRETGLMGTPSKLTFLPLVSYLQMLAALSVAGQAPTGFGHTYHRELLEAWVGLLGLQQTELAQREFLNSVAEAIRADLDDYNKGIAAPARGARQDPVGD